MPCFRSAKSWLQRTASAVLSIGIVFSSSGIATAFEDPPTVANAGLFTSQSAVPKVDNATGAFTYHIPFDIPPGRNGRTPDVALEYNSQNLFDGLAGYGWNLSIPYIERMNKTGTEDLYTNSATFRSSLDGELRGTGTSTITQANPSTSTPAIIDSLPVTLRKVENATSHSFSYTVPSGGTNKILVMILAKNDCPTAPTGATQNGQSLTISAVSGTGSRACYFVGYLANPSTGTFQVNFSGATYAEYMLLTLQNAAQSSPIDVTNVTNEGNQSSNSTSVTTTSGNDLLLSFPMWEGTTWSSYGAGETEYMAPASSAAGWNAGSYKNAASTAGTETMTINISSSRDVDETIIAIKGAATTTLVATTTYRAFVASDLTNVYASENDAWVMYDKNGTRYLFGTTTQARQYATTSPSNVFKWMLEEVRDTNGNYIKYEYTSDENQIYPSKITYTGNGATDGPFEIDFTYETRPDTVTSYATAFKVLTKKRLTQVQASIDDSWVRKYVLTYASGVNGTRSLLASVTETGRDENGTETTLPGYYFGYSSSTPAYTTHSAPRVWNVSRVVGDADGNGLMDRAIFRNNSGPGYTTREIKENNYPGFTSRSANNTSYEYWTYDNLGGEGANENPPLERGVRFFDANGDGKADIVRGVKTGSSSYTRAYYQNTYNGSYSWQSTSTAEGTIPAFSVDVGGTDQYSTGFLGNVNGDGLIDYVLSMSAVGNNIESDNGTYLHVASSTGWAVATSTFSPVTTVPTSPGASQQYLVDINGDGLDDWMSSGSGQTNFCLNTGTTWLTECTTSWSLSTSTLGLNGYDKGIRFIDVNGDGLPDYVRSYDISNYGNKYDGVSDIEVGTFNYVYLNTGSGWATSSLQAPASNLVSGVQNPSGWWTGKIDYNEFVDWNGDGTPDHEGAVSTN